MIIATVLALFYPYQQPGLCHLVSTSEAKSLLPNAAVNVEGIPSRAPFLSRFPHIWSSLLSRKTSSLAVLFV